MMNYKGQKLQNLAIWVGILAALCILLIPQSSLAQISVSVGNGKTQYTRNGKTTIKFNDWQKAYKIEFEGDFELSDDDTDIISVSRGGYFEISRAAFGSKRRVIIESDGRGNLTKEYYVGRERTDYEPEGREWLAEVLPDIVRSTTIGAESRVNRFYRKGGATAVMEEVDELEGDYLKTHYIKLLLDKDGLSSGDLVTVIDGAAREVNSDYYLTEILKDHEDEFFETAETSKAFIEASEEVDSDHYRSEILKRVLSNSQVEDENLELVLRSAEDINSDHYLTEVLREALDERDMSDELISKLIATARSINSDHYQSQLFRDALDHNQISDESYWEIIDAAGDISSDHYKTELFKELLERDLDDRTLSRMIDEIEDDISSDHYSNVLLVKIISDQNLGKESTESFKLAVRGISSDHYASQIIIRAADDANLDDELVKSLLESAEDIGSDHYLSQSLIALADYINESGSSELRDLYRSIARDINSDTYYGRAMKALR